MQGKPACKNRRMNATDIQIDDEVVVGGRDRFAVHACKVVAIQRRRFRAEIEWPDGHRTWHPVRELRRVG